MNEPSPRLVLQRVRNPIIEHLELCASFDRQRAYAANVPFVHVPQEIINQWSDWIIGLDDDALPWPMFTHGEREALRRFAAVRDAAARDLGDEFPSLDDVQREASWIQMAEAASIALGMFESRGRLSEEIEMVEG